MTHHPNTCKICRLVSQGMSNADIGRATGLKASSIRGHHARYGITTGERVPKRYLFCALVDDGVAVREAAERAGITYDYALELLRNGDREPPPRKNELWSDVVALGDAEHVRRLIAAGGYERLSEKPTRTGPVVCLPVIPFCEAA